MKYEKVPDSIYEEYPDVYAYGEDYLALDELFRKETEAELFCLFDVHKVKPSAFCFLPDLVRHALFHNDTLLGGTDCAVIKGFGL